MSSQGRIIHQKCAAASRMQSMLVRHKAIRRLIPHATYKIIKQDYLPLELDRIFVTSNVAAARNMIVVLVLRKLKTLTITISIITIFGVTQTIFIFSAPMGDTEVVLTQATIVSDLNPYSVLSTAMSARMVF